jgi:hypothetical protein
MTAWRYLPPAMVALVFVAAAQDATPPPPSPEIRGAVLDPDSKQPVAFAEISLYFLGAEQPRVFTGLGMMDAAATAVTGFSGDFVFHLDKPGYYAVAAKKEGYNSPGANSGGGSSTQRIAVTRDTPVQQARLFLARPGQLTGIVADEETRKPLANVRVMARRPAVKGTQMFGSGIAGSVAVSGADGAFVIPNLPAGEFVVDINRQKSGKDRLLAKFTDEDLKTVDQDFEHTVWPGGHGDDAAVPVLLGSGGSTDVGVIRVRKVPYYRLHVKVPPSTCAPDATMQVYEQVPGSMLTISQDASCKQDFLVTGFSPGSYQLLLAVNTSDQAAREMATVPFVIVDKSVEITAPLQRGVTVDARFVAADGAKPADWTTATITLYPRDMLPFIELASPHKADADGKVRLVGVPMGRHDLSIGGIGAGNYIKEVRYNGFPVAGRTLRVDPAAMAHSLTIVVDDKPATITGSVTKGDEKASKPYVLLVKWPITADEPFRPTATTSGNENGQFQFSGLVPGEYRLIALASRDEFDARSANTTEHALATAQKIEIGPGGSQNITVELTVMR